VGSGAAEWDGLSKVELATGDMTLCVGEGVGVGLEVSALPHPAASITPATITALAAAIILVSTGLTYPCAIVEANLIQVDLTGGYLTRANLSGAKLTDAVLTSADLTGGRGGLRPIWRGWRQDCGAASKIISETRRCQRVR
jgi:Pentapeptide repeats (8 copies)